MKTIVQLLPTLECLLHDIVILLQDGATPLFMASQDGHKEVAQLLLQNGAQPDIPHNVCIIIITIAY